MADFAFGAADFFEGGGVAGVDGVCEEVEVVLGEVSRPERVHVGGSTGQLWFVWFHPVHGPAELPVGQDRVLTGHGYAVGCIA